MAVRLSVIMVQTPPASVAGQSLAESTIGSVIGVAGIDLALVGRIEQIDPSSTDYLTLESLTGDVAYLDWGPQEQSLQKLNQIGFHGFRARHAGDPDATDEDGTGSRRIYAFDLNQFDNGASVCESLTKLLKTRQTKTFSLGPAPIPGVTKRSTAQPASPTTKVQAPKAVQKSEPPALQRHSESDLDRLLDDLDSLDP